jgi:hypothetical protein
MPEQLLGALQIKGVALAGAQQGSIIESVRDGGSMVGERGRSDTVLLFLNMMKWHGYTAGHAYKCR